MVIARSREIGIFLLSKKDVLVIGDSEGRSEKGQRGENGNSVVGWVMLRDENMEHIREAMLLAKR